MIESLARLAVTRRLKCSHPFCDCRWASVVFAIITLRYPCRSGFIGSSTQLTALLIFVRLIEGTAGVNIILFEESEIDAPLLINDPRMVHLLEVLRRQIGDATDVGLVNGPRGKAVLRSVSEDQVTLEFSWNEEPEPLLPIDLIVGLSRPQTSRKILQEATSLGVRRIHFVATDRGERSYATSKLWTTNEWRQCIRSGVEQAFSTRFPEVCFDLTLTKSIEAMNAVQGRICMDNYEAKLSLTEAAAAHDACVLAVGSERGWSAAERDLFRQHGFSLAHLGERPLRTETATIAAISIIAAGLQS